MAVSTVACGDCGSPLTKSCVAGLAHLEAGHRLIVAVLLKLLLRNRVEIAEGPLVLTKAWHILHRRGDFTGQRSTLLQSTWRHIDEIYTIIICLIR